MFVQVSLKPRVCSFLVTRFMWLKIWVQLVLDARLHPFLLESIFYSLASLLSSGCTISGEERRCLCSGGVYLLSQLEWSLLFPAQFNARHAHAQCLTSPCWAEVSHSSVHRFVSHNCFSRKSVLFDVGTVTFSLDRCFTGAVFLFFPFYPDHTIVFEEGFL